MIPGQWYIKPGYITGFAIIWSLVFEKVYNYKRQTPQ